MKSVVGSLVLLVVLVLSIACVTNTDKKEDRLEESTSAEVDSLRFEQEKHLRNVRQLTFGGDNAEAYFSFDNQYLVMQVTNPSWDIHCDQIFTYDLNKPIGQDDRLPMVSTGRGRTTCSFFMPDGEHVLYASTHAEHEDCPETPHRGPGGEYVWPIYPEFDIYVADLQGNITGQLTDEPGYDAEATISPQGDKIVFTSMRSGDLELYTMNIDGSDVKQITDVPGYDGGAFFSPDGQYLVFRASRPADGEELDQYRQLLAKGLVQPTKMEIFVCKVDGSDMRQITNLGGANWAPYFLPDGKRILFSSNHASERGFPFNIYMINLDGTGLEQVTYDDTFASFPMFSYDGRQLVFSSNRFNGGDRSTNVFIADWID